MDCFYLAVWVPWEELTAVNSWLILIVSGILSTIIVFFLNFYVLVPLKNSEATISISEKDMEGRVATVITPIPVRGMGEIQLKSVTGSLSRPAILCATRSGAKR